MKPASDHVALIDTATERFSSPVRLKILRQLLLSIIVAMMPVIAIAQTKSPAEQLATRFTSFCLRHRLTRADLSQRATRMGAIQESVMSDEDHLRILWRDPASQFGYSFDTSALPRQHLHIVGCSVGGRNLPVASVIAALQLPSRLGKSNDDNAPSLIARNAGWFFVKNKEPNWVSVIAMPSGDDQIVIVGISTHQEDRWNQVHENAVSTPNPMPSDHRQRSSQRRRNKMPHSP